jgi:hypothetical protein
MPFRHKLYYAIAFLHLLMIGLYASHFAEWGGPTNKVTDVVGTVGNFTGSNNIFSFFAPALSDQPYVVYAVKDTLGKEHMIDLTGHSPDFTNRINNIYGYLTLPEARSIISASLAAFVIRRYPSADKVRVAMVVQQIPDMNEFKNGVRSHWRFWFHRDFKRDSITVATSKLF